jgi:hypothetical protein
LSMRKSGATLPNDGFQIVKAWDGREWKITAKSMKNQKV